MEKCAESRDLLGTVVLLFQPVAEELLRKPNTDSKEGGLILLKSRNVRMQPQSKPPKKAGRTMRTKT